MTDSRKMAVIGLIKAHIARLSADGELLNEIQYFCEQLEKASLKQRVEDALSFRKQGHFDKAMLGISEVNRDQVTALRKIQALLGFRLIHSQKATSVARAIADRKFLASLS